VGTRLRRLSVCGLLIALLCAPAAARAEWFKRVEDGIMGTRIAVELWAGNAAQADEAIGKVLAEMRRVDEAMSTYKTTSEVSRVNAAGGRSAGAGERRTLRPPQYGARLFAAHRRRL
jgi:thiamine biosynthesis lipoprotein